MNPSIRILAIALPLCVGLLAFNTTVAQDAGSGDFQPGGLTDRLLSRGELRRILDRPTGQNPLRHQAPPLGATFRAPQNAQPLPQRQAQAPAPQNAPPQIDPNFRRASWAEEIRFQEPVAPEPTPAAVAEAPAKAVPEPESTPQVFGPQPSPEMQQRWQQTDMLVDFSVENLIQEIGERRRKLDSSLGIDEQAKNKRLQHLEQAESAAQKALQNVSTKDSLQTRIMSFDEELERLRKRAKEALELPPLEENIAVDQMQLRLRNLQAELDHEKVKGSSLA